MTDKQQSDETRRRVQRILEESSSSLARRDLERAQELQARRRNNFAVMLCLVAIFLVGLATFVRASRPNDAIVMLGGSLLLFVVAGLYTDSGNALLRQIETGLRRRWRDD